MKPMVEPMSHIPIIIHFSKNRNPQFTIMTLLSFFAWDFEIWVGKRRTSHSLSERVLERGSAHYRQNHRGRSGFWIYFSCAILNICFLQKTESVLNKVREKYPRRASKGGTAIWPGLYRLIRSYCSVWRHSILVVIIRITITFLSKISSARAAALRCRTHRPATAPFPWPCAGQSSASHCRCTDIASAAARF